MRKIINDLAWFIPFVFSAVGHPGIFLVYVFYIANNTQINFWIYTPLFTLEHSNGFLLNFASWVSFTIVAYAAWLAINLITLKLMHPPLNSKIFLTKKIKSTLLSSIFSPVCVLIILFNAWTPLRGSDLGSSILLFGMLLILAVNCVIMGVISMVTALAVSKGKFDIGAKTFDA